MSSSAIRRTRKVKASTLSLEPSSSEKKLLSPRSDKSVSKSTSKSLSKSRRARSTISASNTKYTDYLEETFIKPALTRQFIAAVLSAIPRISIFESRDQIKADLELFDSSSATKVTDLSPFIAEIQGASTSSSSSTSRAITTSASLDFKLCYALPRSDLFSFLKKERSTLFSLDLSRCTFSERDIREIADAIVDNDRCLSISLPQLNLHADILDRTAVWLTHRLKSNLSLIDLAERNSTIFGTALSSLLDSNLKYCLCQLGVIDHLPLGTRELSQPPRSMAALTALASLDLSNNSISLFPPEIALLENLKVLDLSQNALTQIPPSISSLLLLRVLDVSSNKLSTLPQGLAQLPLEIVDLGCNQFSSLNDPVLQALSKLPTLHSVTLAGNPLTELKAIPRELHATSGLELLNYSRRMERQSVANLSTRILLLSITPNLLPKHVSMTSLFSEPKHALAQTLSEKFSPAELHSSFSQHPVIDWQVCFQMDATKTYSLELHDMSSNDTTWTPTHPLFLTARSISVVLFSITTRSDCGHVMSFLQNIRLFGGSRVLLLGVQPPGEKRMKAKELTEVINFYRTQCTIKDVPFVFYFDPTDASSVRTVKEQIIGTSFTQPHHGERLPNTLTRFITQIQTLRTDSIRFLSIKSFSQIAKRLGFSSSSAAIVAKVLAGMGHILITSSSSHIVIDPYWMATLYSMLIKSPHCRFGKLFHSSLEQIWPSALCLPTQYPIVLQFFSDFHLLLSPDQALLGTPNSSLRPSNESDTTDIPSLRPQLLQTGEQFSLAPSCFLSKVPESASQILYRATSSLELHGQTLCRVWSLRYLPGQRFLASLMFQLLLADCNILTYWRSGCLIQLNTAEKLDLGVLVIDNTRSNITFLSRGTFGSRLFRIVEDHLRRCFYALKLASPSQESPVVNIWVQCAHCLQDPTHFINPHHFKYTDLVDSLLQDNSLLFCPNGPSSSGHNAAASSVRVPLTLCAPDLTLEDFREQGLILDLHHCEIEKTLGKGGFGLVQLGYIPPSRRPLAIKKIMILDDEEKESLDLKVTDFRREITAHALLKHPNIVDLVGFSVHSPLSIVQEYCPGGDLYHALQQWKREGKKLPLHHIVQIAYEIATAIEYMHCKINPAMIHRDIKAPNVLLMTRDLFGAPHPDYPICKLADFGLSTCFPVAGDTHAVENPCWLAPEAIEHGNYSRKSDVFGFAITMWEVMFGLVPYCDLQYRFSSELGAMIINGARPSIPRRSKPKQYLRLMTRAWSQNPERRPDITLLRGGLGTILRKIRQESYPDLPFLDVFEMNLSDSSSGPSSSTASTVESSRSLAESLAEDQAWIEDAWNEPDDTDSPSRRTTDNKALRHFFAKKKKIDNPHFIESTHQSSSKAENLHHWVPSQKIIEKNRDIITKLLQSEVNKYDTSDPSKKNAFQLFYSVLGVQPILDEIAGAHWLALEEELFEFEDETAEIQTARTDFELFASTLSIKKSPVSPSLSSSTSIPSLSTSTSTSSVPIPTSSTNPESTSSNKKKKGFFGMKKKSKTDKSKPEKPKKQSAHDRRVQEALASSDLQIYLQF